jgi:hypothetical protein
VPFLSKESPCAWNILRCKNMHKSDITSLMPLTCISLSKRHAIPVDIYDADVKNIIQLLTMNNSMT